MSIVPQPTGSPIVDLHHNRNGIMSCTIPGKVILTTATSKEPNSWEEYTTTICTWEQNLLQNLEEKPGAYGTLKVLLKLQEKIWLVMDGGLNESIGYFGWVIASDRQILWENRSHAQGE
eukprot:5040762-Ditylum_brightwellii.AAC.1